MRKEISCLGNGSVVLLLGKFAHSYDCMEQLVSDLEYYFINNSTKDWDNNEYKDFKEIKNEIDVETFYLDDPFLWPDMINSGSKSLRDLAEIFLSRGFAEVRIIS